MECTTAVCEWSLHTVHTLGEPAGFWPVLEEKLVALVAPDFCDDDISREVCHWAVGEDGEAEEKGCVYNLSLIHI